MDHNDRTSVSKDIRKFRDRLADNLGVGQERKAEIYIELSKSATLRDTSYWLQILFSAGIATLGLVLNSPAVIIGAMLISPLMGPILAGGLALAAGDLTLGMRAIVNLALSCLVAVAFAMLLVGFLPFKEITGEIAARTQPNILDLVIALFSGAIGSVAVCKEVKGVVTSIPGVAIAVALMPPLCVVGYGLGVAVSLNGAEGMRVARGGGLLFLTNLVAIMFTAMIVFLALHIDTQSVRERVAESRQDDGTHGLVQALISRLPASKKLRKIGNLPSRFIFIILMLALILIPLSQSFIQLKDEIARKQYENKINLAATEVWQQSFAKQQNGQPRSYIGHLSESDHDGKLTLQLRVFTSNPLTASERAEYTRQLAARLARPEASVAVELLEIPTASSELFTQRDEKKSAPTAAELQAGFSKSVESLGNLRLPPPAQLVDYQLVTSGTEPPQVKLIYLSDRDIGADAQDLIADQVRTQLNYPDAKVSMERVESSFGPLTFARNQTTVTATDTAIVDRAGQLLQQHPTWHLEIAAGAEQNERDGTADERAKTISSYLTSKWQISTDRITAIPATGSQRSAILEIKMGDVKS